MESKTVNTSIKVALGIAIALFVGLGVFSTSLYKEKVENEKVLVDEKTKVLNELNQMAVQYDVAMRENKVVNQNLVEAKARIEANRTSRVQGQIDRAATQDTGVPW